MRAAMAIVGDDWLGDESIAKLSGGIFEKLKWSQKSRHLSPRYLVAEASLSGTDSAN